MQQPLAEPAGDAAEVETTEVTIARLVGQVYECASPAERSRLLEHLLRPLGVLSLFAIANGIFAKIRLHSGWQEVHVRLDDVRAVQAGDVMALVDHVQQVSVECVDGLAQLLAASPAAASSAAAALLIAMLLQRARKRRGGAPAVEARPGA